MILFSRLKALLRRAFRGLRIWRAVLTLLLFLWWDARAFSYPGGSTPERRAARQQLRARWLTQ